MTRLHRPALSVRLRAPQDGGTPAGKPFARPPTRSDRLRGRRFGAASPRTSHLRTLVLLAVALLTAACERESRPFRDLPVAAARTQVETQSSLYAGMPAPATGTLSPYQENAYGIGEGKRLYSQLNCVGCHAHGGGGIGPPLMDDEWRYGFTPFNIYSAIVEGRPNGMPSYRNKIPDAQIWQIVAYVQSMSGQTPIDASPGRDDHLLPHPPESIQPYSGRVQTGHK